MNELEQLVERLRVVSYRLELTGETLAIEAREVRAAAEHVREQAEQHASVGRPFDNGAAIEAAYDKFAGSVESELRYQVDIIRDVTRKL